MLNQRKILKTIDDELKKWDLNFLKQMIKKYISSSDYQKNLVIQFHDSDVIDGEIRYKKEGSGLSYFKSRTSLELFPNFWDVKVGSNYTFKVIKQNQDIVNLGIKYLNEYDYILIDALKEIHRKFYNLKRYYSDTKGFFYLATDEAEDFQIDDFKSFVSQDGLSRAYLKYQVLVPYENELTQEKVREFIANLLTPYMKSIYKGNCPKHQPKDFIKGQYIIYFKTCSEKYVYDEINFLHATCLIYKYEGNGEFLLQDFV